MLTNADTNFYHNVNHKNKITTLVGMMGTGKSKFGRLVSKALNFNFYDIDSLIEKEFNTTIKNLFEKNGETFFRKVEKETIKKIFFKVLKSKEKAIISIGGGAFDLIETREILLKSSNVIWLNTPIDVLIKRIGNGSKRPMIKEDVKKSVHNLLKKRIKFYSLSHYQIDTKKLSQIQITKKIIDIIS